MIKAYHELYYKIRKSFVRDQEKESFKKKLESFKRSSTFLFDVAACKCPIILECICKKNPDMCVCPISIKCKCEKAKKIPVLELRFIYLQRKCNMGKIGSVDVLETRKLEKKQLRNSTLADYYKINQGASTSCESGYKFKMITELEHEQSENEQEDGNNESDDERDELFKPNKRKLKTSKPWQMRTNLKATVLTSDRYGVSDRATAAITSSVLQDFGIINEKDLSHVVDKNKVRREKNSNRQNLQSKDISEPLRGLYFDGRKDETMVIEMIDSKRYRRTQKEEHYSLIQEPGSKYLCHVSPITGHSKDIAVAIVTHLAKLNISLQELDLVGCDGTGVNTGWKNGVIRQIELKIGRPLQWCICLLHFNELPFRHLFHHLDGATAGPSSFTGEVGQKMKTCEKRPVVNFLPIDCIIPDADKKKLSKDQLYLLDISAAIKLGQCPADLVAREPGPLSHSRWVTAANRVLRLYISEENPSDELKQLVYFILHCYMPLWFRIKASGHFSEGLKIVFEAIRLTRYLPEYLRKVIDPVIERNSYFAHPENLILAMVMDERQHVRELGLRRILKARKNCKGKTIRNFRVPTLCFNAIDYVDMIQWNAYNVTPPPLLRNVPDEDIEEMIKTGRPLISDFNVFVYPCHTQAVERCVKLVSEASQSVCGTKARDGYIRSTLLSRSRMPEFSSKAAFNVCDFNNQ